MEWAGSVKIAKQMIEFQKSVFENTFNAMVALQNQAENATNGLLAQAPWLPEEGKNAINQWVKSYKDGRENYKKMMDQAFGNMESFFKSE